MKNFRFRMKMTVPIMLLLLQTLSITAQTITQNFPKETLVARLEKIATKSKQAIVYDPVALTGISVSALVSKNLTPELIIQKSLVNSGWTYKITSDKTIVIIKVVSPATPRPTGSGHLSGTVTDEKGEPVIGATVRIAGTSQGTITDVKGNYTLQAPAGETTMEVSFLSYQKKKITGVDIRPDKTTKLDITLSEDNKQLSEVTVTAQVQRASAAGMLLQQKNNISMTDGISSDLIKKTSDNNVAQVLKRVAGVTINEGKFVTVRGMSERYNNVQLNGSSLPSTEPNRRNFSFDIIPSTLIDNVTVSKTFTPDLPGEFTGGLVQVKTLSVPDTKFLSISLGTGGNTISTGKEFQTNKRYAADYLLGEIDQRTWYAGKGQEAQSFQNAGQMNHFEFYKYTATPLQNYSLSFGLPIKINEKHSLGLVAALTYRHEETSEQIKEVHTFGRDSLVRNMGAGYNYNYKFVTAVGAVANFGWKTANHAVTWRNLYNNRYTHTTVNRFMQASYDMVTRYEVYSTPLQARLMQTQIDGEHNFFRKNLTVTWNADYNKTSRTNPDDRYAQASINPGTNGVVSPSANGTYLFNWWWGVGPSQSSLSSQFVMQSKLEETKKNAGANAEYKFNLLNQIQKLKAGYLRSLRNAEYDQQYLHVFDDEIIYKTTSLDGTNLKVFYDPANFNNGTLYYKSTGFSDRKADYYEGNQTIDAAYLMADICTVKSLHIIGGFRMENAETKVTTTFSWFDDNANKNLTADSIFIRNDLDWLPSLTAIYAITPKLNFRAAYSKTLARPDFRELSRSGYYNVSERLEVYNTKPVEQSSAKNYDLRLEYYPSAGEVVSLSAFYKDFHKPVEKIVKVQSDMQNFYLLTVNLDRAILRGLELNFRKNFGFLSPVLNNLWLGGNATVLEGNISYESWNSKRERPLQGLAPYNVNGSLSYEGSCLGMAANFTRVGRTLMYGGDFAKHDQYENPRNVLDLQLSARFLKQRLEVKLNVSDILNEDIIIYRNCDYDPTNDQKADPGDYHDRTGLGMDYNEGDWVMSRINKGVNYSFSVSYKF